MRREKAGAGQPPSSGRRRSGIGLSLVTLAAGELSSFFRASRRSRAQWSFGRRGCRLVHEECVEGDIGSSPDAASPKQAFSPFPGSPGAGVGPHKRDADVRRAGAWRRVSAAAQGGEDREAPRSSLLRAGPCIIAADDRRRDESCDRGGHRGKRCAKSCLRFCFRRGGSGYSGR